MPRTKKNQEVMDAVVAEEVEAVPEVQVTEDAFADEPQVLEDAGQKELPEREVSDVKEVAEGPETLEEAGEVAPASPGALEAPAADEPEADESGNDKEGARETAPASAEAPDVPVADEPKTHESKKARRAGPAVKAPRAARPSAPQSIPLPPAEGYTGEVKTFGEDPWPELYEALRTRAVIQGTVAGLERFEGKDALTVHFGPAKGIIEEDDLGDRPKKLAQMIGSVVAFKVKAIDRRQGRVFLSRKEALDGMAEKTWAALEREAGVVIAIQAKINDLLPEVKKLEESNPRYREVASEIKALRQEAKEKGPKRTCAVRWVTADGAYVDIGGVMAFLPGKEMSYGKVEDARECGVRVGDNLDVRVYSVDRTRERVLVTLKPFLPDPWASAALKYVKGGLYQGTVSRSLGGRAVLVALEPGVEVFVPALPLEPLPPGAKVLVRVLGVDSVRRRVSGRISRVLSRAG